ncbi:MAG: CBS domain-containing protein [Tunicatimonas sp.]
MNNDQRLIDQFLTSHRDIAIAAIEELTIDEVVLLLEDMAPNKSAAVLSSLPSYKAGRVLDRMSLKNAVNVVGLLPIPVSESILRSINRPLRQQIVAELPMGLRKHLKRALTFRKDQVGAHLESDLLTLSESSTVEKALLEIKTTTSMVRSPLFVVDKAKTLVGYIETNDLLANEPQKTIRSIKKPVSQVVASDMTVKDALEHWDDSFVYLPVVKGEGQFLGAVSRNGLSALKLANVGTDKSAVKAGSALGDLYLVGLTSLLGSSDQNKNS